MFDFDPDMLLALAKEMENEPHFGISLDYAHATISKVEAKKWFEVLKPYIKHMHINDNDLKNDMHMAIGTGNINYKELKELLESCETEPSILVEVSKLDDQEASLVYMKNTGLL